MDDEEAELILVTEENHLNIQNFLRKKLIHFIKEYPESLMALDLFKTSLNTLFWETQKFLEIIQIYNSNVIIECSVNSQKAYYFTKFCSEILHQDFYALNASNNDFSFSLRKILKLIIKNYSQKETKSIIYINFDSKENVELWNYLSIIMEGINICMIFEKDEIIEIMGLLKNESELDSLKYDHKIYKISKKLMHSIKFILCQEKKDNNLKNKHWQFPDLIPKNFIKFPLKETQICPNELKEIEKEIITTALTEAEITKIEYSKNIELALSPHFEDFYEFNLLKSRDQYMKCSEVLTKNIRKMIEAKYHNLKNSYQIGKNSDFLIRTKQNFKENIVLLEKNIKNLINESEKQEEEIKENMVKVEKLNNELNGNKN